MPRITEAQVVRNYQNAAELYRAYGVDPEEAMRKLAPVQLSLHCWQGDDVHGFESHGALDGGIMATGNYPGRARNGDELRADYEQAFALVPGTHRINLHAIYAETNGKNIPRNELSVEHFARWIDWAKAHQHAIDFNPTCFSHPLASSGLTLSNQDAAIRKFWIEHAVACRKIAQKMGEATGQTSVVNLWIPDGYKDVPADRLSPRMRLQDSLDAIFSQTIDRRWALDALEGKLFGIGSECYVVGSHEFYQAYALKHGLMPCLDAGHYHPTETISDKISSLMLFFDRLLLHVSRGVRWDSDHVVTLDDDLRAICREVVAGDFLRRVYIALDYFDASINRVAAWTIGSRNTLRGLLIALLEPTELMRAAESAGDLTSRLALIEEAKGLPWSAVWDYYCLKNNVPVGDAWLRAVKGYETKVLAERA